ncbi:hypothetical protein HOS58_gp29 [Streptomyces phage Attoomi]|uniref:Uncharacterized protein n=1 Tax=Streptomyces phage Attoomi TaxID=2059881 RepID=A0A2H5BLK0_9CAUD|nr:hypothetical protein HOS58_gp29 [Streptomyces phage Attoomi]AUG87161.1 hypothetical protein SEA_ATTOOMI_29 [Streptomyces phage Attoomi]
MSEHTDHAVIDSQAAPALGEIRAMKAGGVVYLRPSAKERADWPRYIDALASAMAHGVSVRWVRP